jgi:WD40 repeat protein/energy-coupling factor transporter ATP-binding protein EcfA2
MTVRIFFSSPGDVKMERETAKRIVDRLQSEIGAAAVIEPYFWEHEVMVATKDYQENIPHMDDFDIVVCILWSRLGTPLDPARHPRPGGGGFESGTEYEFFTAMRAHELKGTPDIFVFRNTTEPRRPSRPREAREAVDREIDRLDSFFDSYFQDNQFFTRAINIYSTLGEFEEKLTIALRSYITGRIPNAPSKRTKKPKYHRQPYLGLSAFNYEDAPVFFGRTAQVGEIITAFQTQELDANAAADVPPKHFVLILGSSGSGKSSLARAGVLPMLTNPGVIEGANAWRTAIFKPADAPGDPILALVQSLTDHRALPELFADGTTPREIADLIRSQPQGGGLLLRQALTQAGALALTKKKHELEEKLALLVSEHREEDAKALRETIENLKAPGVRIALLADQLEELFTSDLSPDTLAVFIGILIALANSGRVFVLATLRSDFYPRCLEHPNLIALMQGGGTYALPAPSAADIGQMIRQPAAIAGLTFEENPSTGENLDDLLRDAALKDPAALPLLSYTLEQLYERREDDGTLTLKAYRDLGGLEGAIGTRAETVFTSLPSNAQAAFDGLCKQLVTLCEGGEPTRRRASYATLTRTPEAKTLLDALINARLLSADQSPAGERVVSVAHEALLRHWPRLVAWVEENRLFLNTRTRVASRMADWLEKNKSEEYLLPRGPNLSAAESILAGHLASLDPQEIEFIGRSAEKVRREDQRKLRNARLITMGAVALCLIAVAGGLFAMAAKRQAQEERNAAIEQERLANESRKMAVAATARSGIHQIETGSNSGGLVALAQTLTIDPNHRGVIARLYSEQLYSLPKAIPVRSFHAETATRQRISGAQEGPRQYMAFITDKKHPAVLDLDTFETVSGPWEEEPDSLAPLISEDSAFLANIRMDRSTRIWNVSTGKSGPPITASENFSQLGFTKDGGLFIDCHDDGLVQVIDTGTGKEVDRWNQSKPTIWISVSANRHILSSSQEELVIYDRTTGEHRVADIPLDGRDLVSCIAAREGSTAVVQMRGISEDKTRYEDSIAFLDASTGTLVENSRVINTGTMIWKFAPNNDGSSVALALHDAAPEIRHISDPLKDAKFTYDSNDTVNVALSPDERLLVAADSVGTVTVFSTETRKPAFHPIPHAERLEEILVSWDGRHLLTTTSKTATVWDLAVSPALHMPVGFTPNAGLSTVSGKRLRIHLGKSIDWLDLASLETRIEVRFPHPKQGVLLSGDLKVLATYMPDKGMEFHSTADEPPVKLSSWNSPGGDVNYWEMSSDGSTFASSDRKGVIHFAHTATGKTISSVAIPLLGEAEKAAEPGATEPKPTLQEMRLTPDGRHLILLIRATEDATSASRIFLIDVAAGTLIPHQESEVFSPVIRISENSRHIAVSGSPVGMAYTPQILIWDTTRPDSKPVSVKHTNAINDFRFSPDSSLLALAGQDRIARVFHLPSFRQAAEPISANAAPFSLIAFSPDSSMLAIASDAGDAKRIRVWNWREASPISVPFHIPVMPTAMHFSEDGAKLVAIRPTSAEAGSDGCTVHVWEILPPAEIAGQILPLVEAVTAYRIRPGALPAAIDPAERWQGIRRDFPDSWFLREPFLRTISPGFTASPSVWMDSPSVSIDDLLSAMPAVGLANAFLANWEQANLNRYRENLSSFAPGTKERGEALARISETEARIARLTSFAERNARTDPAVCHHLAMQARRKNNNARAIEFARKAIALDPDHEDSTHLLAIIYQGQGKIRDANLLYKKLCSSTSTK